MGKYRLSGRELRVAYLLYKGKTYDAISNEVRCSNRFVAGVKRRFQDSGIVLRKNSASNVANEGMRIRKTRQTIIVGPPKEVVEILHKAIRTRLISNNESKRLLFWVLNGR